MSHKPAFNEAAIRRADRPVSGMRPKPRMSMPFLESVKVTIDKREAARELCEKAKTNQKIDVITRIVHLNHESDSPTKSYLIEAASFLVTSKHARSVIPVLASCLDSDDLNHRQLAVAGFERYVENGGDISQYLEVLIKRLRVDISPNIRNVASQTLINYAKQNEANAITILDLLPETKNSAIGVLKSFCLDAAPSKRKSEIESLVGRLSDPSSDAIFAIMNELDWHMVSGAAEMVLEALNSSEVPFEIAKDLRQRCRSV